MNRPSSSPAPHCKRGLCRNRAVEDGYCNRHHPDNLKRFQNKKPRITDTDRFNFWLTHSHIVICEMDGQYAIYSGPSPATGWYPTQRAAFDAFMEKYR